MARFRLLVSRAQQVVSVADSGINVLRGKMAQELKIIQGPASILINESGYVELVDSTDVVEAFISSQSRTRTELIENEIDATGKIVVPGFVDSHTHSVWAGDRVHEFAMKLAGATYMDVHKAGGGIMFTVDRTEQTSEEELYNLLVDRLRRMSRCGTTTVEVKTGYGLRWPLELKMLRVIEKAQRQLDWIDVVSTYCAAHAVPKDSTAAEATEDIINNQIPALKQMIDTGELHVDNIDVFCEKGVFDTQQSERILKAGQNIGLKLNFHGDELHPTKSAEMGAELGALAISHLEEISDEGISAMSRSGSVAVLLPTTAYILRLKAPPARRMIDSDVAVALGSDFNPNAFCLSMPLVMHLACVLMHMSMAEALSGATINSAAALGLSDSRGTIVAGKLAGLVLFDAPRWEHLIYQLGGQHDLISHVVKAGRIVFPACQYFHLRNT